MRFIRRLVIVTSFVAMSCNGGSGITSPDTQGGTRILGVGFGEKVPSLIAFSRNPKGKYPAAHDIYMMFPDGSHVKRLTSNAADDDFPAWSPDGLSLAFVSNRESQGGGNHDAYRMITPSRLVRLTNHSWEFDVSVIGWAHEFIIAAEQNMLTGVPFDLIGLSKIDPQGKSAEMPVTTGFSGNYDPCVSRDGKAIAFCARVNCPSEEDPGCGGTLQLFLLRQGDTKPIQLTHFGGDPSNPILTRNPSFDAGGTRIVFQTTAWGKDFEIAYVRIADGKASEPLRQTENAAEDVEPCFDPSGFWIAFASNRDGNYEIYKTWDKYNLSARPVPEETTVRLTNTEDDEGNPDWSVAY